MVRRKNRRRDENAGSKPDKIPLVEYDKARSEGEVFNDLRELCKSPGYIHALAFLINNGQLVFADEKFESKDFEKIYRKDRLIRSEVSLLIGLMIQNHLDIDLPDSHVTQNYIDRTEVLLAELHTAMLKPSHESFVEALSDDLSEVSVKDLLTHPSAVREAAFYAAESAFTIQYISLAVNRYRRDAVWLRNQWGFDIEVASILMMKVIDLLTSSLAKKIKIMIKQNPSEWTMLPLFVFSVDDLIAVSDESRDAIESFLRVFSVPNLPCNRDFDALEKQNLAAFTPFIPLPDGKFACFLEYTAAESLYELPYYLMIKDPEYCDKAARGRGDFGEEFVEGLIVKLFDKNKVYKNAVLFKGKDIHSEADLILNHGSRVFVFQIKSKKFTANSKSGNANSISNDFKLAVQDAYDQALKCIEAIRSGCIMRVEGKAVSIPVSDRTRYYPVCVTTEHYPALSYQVSQFLKLDEKNNVKKPLVLDVFALDTIVEFLDNPLYFLDYLAKRSDFQDRISCSHENSILAYHLRRNLYFEDEISFLHIEDDIMVDLDLAMAVRRRGLPGAGTPPGILTRKMDNVLGRILEFSKSSTRHELHELGEFLLSISGDTWDWINKIVDDVIARCSFDRSLHDVSLPIEDSGITIHVRPVVDISSVEHLAGHVALRKYASKAERWFGVCVNVDGQVRFATGNAKPWSFDPIMEREALDLKARALGRWIDRAGRRAKLKPNDPCPCESGRKYKKCHGRLAS